MLVLENVSYRYAGAGRKSLRDINLTKIESRPLRGKPWEYAFYVDVEAPSTDPGLQRAVDHLQDFCHWVRILGSYPSSRP